MGDICIQIIVIIQIIIELVDPPLSWDVESDMELVLSEMTASSGNMRYNPHGLTFQ